MRSVRGLVEAEGVGEEVDSEVEGCDEGSAGVELKRRKEEESG